jgi:hypothetical protein
MVKKLTQIHPKDETGFSDWQFPIHKGYLMQCCDCDLIHEVEFQVVEKVSKVKKDGTWESIKVPKGKYRVKLRMKRHK